MGEGNEEEQAQAEAMLGSITNLKQIYLGMHNFLDIYQAFPPAVVIGPDGRPWHSWRVLILPFLEEQALYEQYRFDEPWDGPNNSKLLDKMPEVYADPVYGPPQGQFTSYAAIVGEGMAFRPEGVTFDGNLKSLSRPIINHQGHGASLISLMDRRIRWWWVRSVPRRRSPGRSRTTSKWERNSPASANPAALPHLTPAQTARRACSCLARIYPRDSRKHSTGDIAKSVDNRRRRNRRSRRHSNG